MKKVLFYLFISAFIWSCNQNKIATDTKPVIIDLVKVANEQQRSLEQFYSPEQSRNTKIYLEVKAKELYEHPENYKQDIVDAHCYLSDDKGSPPKWGSDISDFESPVYRKNHVRWTGDVDLFSGLEGYSIMIEQVQIKDKNGNPNIFKKAIIAGYSGRAKIEVKDEEIKDTITEYSIKFKISPPEGSPLSFIIDPKAKGNN